MNRTSLAIVHLALYSLLPMACGGASDTGSTTRRARSVPVVDLPASAIPPSAVGIRPDTPPAPVEIHIDGTRVGNSVRFDIVGFGRRRLAQDPMEKAENWRVEALAGGIPLTRVVNGSVKVQRFQVGDPRRGIWDIEVAFSLAFAVPERATDVTVHITAPNSPLVKRDLVIGPNKSTLDKSASRARKKASSEKPKAKKNKKKKQRRRKRPRKK